MEEHLHPTSGFGLEYGGQLIFCEAIMQEDHFDIHFDGQYIASIAHNDDWDWMQASGTILPETIIAEIGLRIESYYQ